MGRRIADKPVDAVSGAAVGRAVREAMVSRYKRGMLMAVATVAEAATYTDDELRDQYLKDVLSTRPETPEGEFRDERTWGFDQMMEILFGALTNMSGPELLDPPASN